VTFVTFALGTLVACTPTPDEPPAQPAVVWPSGPPNGPLVDDPWRYLGGPACTQPHVSG
jgi:hypothetical protein